MNEALKQAAPAKSRAAEERVPMVVGMVGGRLVLAIPRRHSATAYPLELHAAGRLETVLPQPRPSHLLSARFNLLFDSAMKSDKLCWQLGDAEAGGIVGLDITEQWKLKDGHTAYLGQRPGDANSAYVAYYEDPVSGRRISVAAGAPMVLSGYFGLHRCYGQVEVEFFDRKGVAVGVEPVSLVSDKQGGADIEGYFAVRHEFTAPERAITAQLRLTKLPTFRNMKDSFLFFTDVQLIHAPAGSDPFDVSGADATTLQRLREAIAHGADFVALAVDLRDHGPGSLELDVRYGTQRLPARGSPFVLPERPRVEGQLTEINGWVVEGVVSTALLAAPDPRIWLHVDESLISSMIPTERMSETTLRFRLPLVPAVMDGRPHLVRASTSDGQIVGEMGAVLPYILTPWQSLEKYAARPLPAALSPVAGHRYESLCASIELLHEQALSPDPVDAETLLKQGIQLHVMHRLLVDGHSGKIDDVSFDFPRHERPAVSIVIPVHNKWPVTRHCLAGLLVAANRASFEVIVVDDGSEDETLELPERAPNITYVRNELAQGFVRACNRGAEQARGQYILFLNNDTEPTAGWIDELLYVFENFDDIGLAGSKLLYPDGQLQEAGGIVWASGDPWNYGRRANPNDPRYSYLRQADYVSGAAVMLPAELWKQIGGFSEEFAPAYFEDTDLAFKVRDAGRKVVYVAQSVVYHYEGLSSGTSTASGMKRFQEINRPKFKRKWARAFANNGEIGKNIDLAKDRGIRGRALIVDAAPPRPYNDAGSYAAIQEIRLLQSLGYKCTFLPQNMAYLGSDTDRLQRMGVETLHGPYFLSPGEALEKRGREFDVIYVTRYYTAQNILWMCRRWAPQAKILFCNADLHFLRQMREASLASDEAQAKVALETREKELAVCRDVDAVLSYSYVEHAVLEAQGIAKSKVATCPWVVELSPHPPPFAARRDIAYLGGFGHGPNKQAMMYFIDQVLPLLRQRIPDAKLRIYGSGSAEALADIKREGVVVEGFIDDVARAYDRCRVFIAPLLTGAGLKGKVVGALAHGVPSVITTIAAEGTHIRDGEEAFIADRPEVWAEKVAALYTDEALWTAMSAKARELAARRFSFQEGRRLMAAALEAAGVFVAADKSEALCHRGTAPR